MLVYPTICLFIAVRSEILLRILIISFQCVRLGLASDLYHYFLLFSSVIFFCSHFFFFFAFFSPPSPAVCVGKVCACCDLFPSHIDPASFSPHGGQIKTHADHPQVTVRGQRSKGAGQGPAHLCVCVSGDNDGDGASFLFHTDTNTPLCISCIRIVDIKTSIHYSDMNK